jgi:regulator of cell morphogenesis and NO signaling
MGPNNAIKRTRSTSEPATDSEEYPVSAEISDPLRNLLCSQLSKAVELLSRVVIEQRPPLCRVLLPLHRLFHEFSAELRSYIELEETDLVPNAMMALGPRATPGELSETVRLLRHGQETLLRLLAEMCELTQGFLAPSGACLSYVQLLDALRSIQTELVREFRLENEVLSPRALSCTRALIN